MADQLENTVNRALGLAVGENEANVDPDVGGSSFFSWVTQTGDLIPGWWSTARDRALSKVWKESNHMSIAVYNTQAKIVGIPPVIIPRDPTNDAHLDQAEKLQSVLFTSSDFGQGWAVTYAKFIESLITQDNGAFMEIIGEGLPAGPIVGSPVSIRHLDSSRCIRTGHPIYPVKYMDDTGKMFKLHRTRVIYMSQMPSSYKEMYGVGFSAVSRSVEIAQTLIDIIRYKQERLGSRPQNQMLIGKGVTGRQIMLALRQHEEDLTNRGFKRYGRTFAIGSENTEIDVTKLDLNHLDPFDEETSMNLGMFAIASAFGMDADEIWPVAGKSAGKAEANIRRMRSRGRLPAQITSELRSQFNYKVLPPHLALSFDFKDDEEDMQQANIRDIRARNRERDLGDGSINVRGARLGMLDSGDLNRPTFEEMELSDGRLPDGSTLSMLFFSTDPVYQRLLNFMDNPLQFTSNINDIDLVEGTSLINDAKLDTILSDIQARRELVLATLAKTASKRQATKVQQSYQALDWLEEQYNFAAGRLLPEVPMQARRMRTDLRVAPEEVSPAQGEQSPAEASMVQDENISTVGGG
jgi:hypothetical protein